MGLAPETRFRLPRRADALLLFLRSEAAGGMLLILASLAALLWSNSAASPGYAKLLEVRLGVGRAALPLHSAVNDGLMALFFLLAGLEIRRELTAGGRLAGLRAAAAPGIAALGGMVMPAAIYLALNHGRPTAHGWAVPVATDIAFSLAVLRVLGARASLSLRVFLTALAILDDLGAILVIALFYTADLSAPALAGAALLCLALWAMNRAGVRVLWPFLLGGAALWVLVFNSGVHATLAGVALAFLVPGRAPSGRPSAAQLLEQRLSPWVAYLVLPVFGLVNAGLDMRATPGTLLVSSAPLGVLLGLCVGKQLGVFGATWAGSRLGLLTLPYGIAGLDLYGAALLCGIGFTMSLFIGDLAFRDVPMLGAIKLAVFGGSLISASAGAGVLFWSANRRARRANTRG